MTKEFTDPVYGKVVYNEKFFSGRKTIYINGIASTKISAKNYNIRLGDENYIYAYIVGNDFSGKKLMIDSREYQISHKFAWYETLLFIAFFVLFFIWGNSPTLCAVVPIVGGLIGGAIIGLCSALFLMILGKVHNRVARLAIIFAYFGATFGTLFLIAMQILANL